MVQFNINYRNPKITTEQIGEQPRDSYLQGDGFLIGIQFHYEDNTHDVQAVQICYSVSLDTKRTYIIKFTLSDCSGNIDVHLSKSSTPIDSIQIMKVGNNRYRFVDNVNHIDVLFCHLITNYDEILSKAYGEEQAKKLTEEYSILLQAKMRELEEETFEDGTAVFKLDNSYNGIFASHHTMYKLGQLTSKDKSLAYEFLIELDRNDPCLGIYYGCRGLIKEGDNAEQQKRLLNEWNENIKEEVCTRLNATFPGKNFALRFKPTDNANNDTFWPFWISLYEDENIREVAARAVIIIRDEYKRFLEKEEYKPDRTCQHVIKNIVKPVKVNKQEDDSKEQDEQEVHSQTRFTEESWEALMKPWNGKLGRFNKDWARLLNRFIVGAKRLGIIEEKDNDRYQKVFIYKGSNTQFAVMMQLLINRIDSMTVEVPWSRIVNQFLKYGKKPWTPQDLKTPNTRYMARYKLSINMSYEAKQRHEKNRNPDKYVRKFIEIMGE